MKKLFIVVRRICLAIFILYGLNVMISAANVMVPINLVTIGIVTILGIPGLLSLVVMFFIL